MRFIKTLGLAAIAALAAMAVVGVSSASAIKTPVSTALCKVNILVCPNAERYPAGTTILGSLLKGTVANLLKGKGDPHPVTCRKSHAKIKTLSLLAAPHVGLLESISFGECHTHFLFFGKILVDCIVTVEQPLAEVLLSKSGTNKGESLLHDHEGTDLLSSVNCEDIVECSYVGDLGVPGSVVGTGPSGEHAALKILESLVTKEVGGAICPAESFLDVHYEILSPSTPLYITL